jgi:hypothetical protein
MTTPTPQPPAASNALATLTNGPQLTEQSRPVAQQLYDNVSTTYLQFRRTFFHESDPTLSTDPPLHPPAQQSETAKLAEGAIRIIPSAVKGVPLVGDIVQHLQRVVEIHTLTENELLSLHNITMVFLYGVRDGIQPWYVAYLNDAAHQLAAEAHPDYFFAFSFHGLFYETPEDLVKFDIALRQGDVATMEAYVQHIGSNLVHVLHDPYKGQEDLSFAGPDGERRKTIFNLKTTAGLAIGGYLGLEAVRALISPHKDLPPPTPVIQVIPSVMQQYTMPRE